MKKLTLLFITLLTSSAYANSSDYDKGEVFWLSGETGQAKVNDSLLLIDEGVSLNLNIGYDFSEYFGLYGGGGSFQNLNSKNVNYLDAGFKFNIPMSESWLTFITLGAASATNSELSGKAHSNVGLGLSYQITPKLSTKVSYSFYKNMAVQPLINKDVNQISWGLTYSFYRPNPRNKIIQQIKIHK